MWQTRLERDAAVIQEKTAATRVEYEFLDQKYVLHASHEEIVEYADRFMKHYRKPNSQADSFITIYAADAIDAQPYREAAASGETFVMHIGKGERWNMRAKAVEAGEWRLVHLLNTGTVFLLNPIRKTGLVLGDLDSYLKEDAFHLIRSVMCRGAEFQHYSIYHAAGTVIDGKGVMIVGESGRGKTTTFLEFICKGAIPVSNDRVFLNAATQPFRMHEWPSFVNTSVGTIQKLPQMRHLMPPDLHFESLEDLWYSKVKLPIEPPDFCTMFDVTYQPSHPIDAVVFPQLRPDCRQSTLRSVSRAEATALLEESCYSPQDPAYLDWHRYVPLDPAELTRQSARITERLLHEVPCFLLEGGTDLSDAIEQVRQLLAR